MSFIEENENDPFYPPPHFHSPCHPRCRLGSDDGWRITQCLGFVMAGSIDVKFLNDVPEDQLRDRMKHYYIRSRKSELETHQMRVRMDKAAEEYRGLVKRLNRYQDLAEEILELDVKNV